MFTKQLTRALRYILIEFFFLAITWSYLPWSFTHVFKKIETTMRRNCMSKALHFLQITAKQQYCPFFTVFLTIKTISPNFSITLLQISLKLHEHRGCYWRKNLLWLIFQEQFPVPRYTAASKIGNSVISMLWQLRRRCNPDHNKFSFLSNTTVVAIFPKLCLWRRSLRSNLGGIDPEKLYRITLRTNRGELLPQKRFFARQYTAGTSSTLIWQWFIYWHTYSDISL